MPDLTIEIMRICESEEHWGTKIGNHKVTYGRQFGKNRNYDYDYECDCDGFKFRKKCRHIEEAKSLRCGWNQQFDTGEVIGGKCPKCGGETKLIKVGV